MSDVGVRQFDDAVARLPALLDALKSAPGHRVAEHPHVTDGPGIYLFSDGERPVYVGQSRKLRTRLRQHTGATNRQNQASFAFNLAKREAALAGVDVKRTRTLLEADPAFVPHFDAARAGVAAMTVRFIELTDPIERTLFEVYAALALDTAEFNSFETH
ncbi:MAG: GIY-YIG nuclease family protein [Actinomycetota bacterium]|nr:GIY-YIG nuclease family protein [Actinomycetota bacterium]